METRLIIAYVLIAMLVAGAGFCVILIRRNLAHKKRRDEGRGDHTLNR